MELVRRVTDAPGSTSLSDTIHSLARLVSLGGEGPLHKVYTIGGYECWFSAGDTPAWVVYDNPEVYAAVVAAGGIWQPPIPTTK